MLTALYQRFVLFFLTKLTPYIKRSLPKRRTTINKEYVFVELVKQFPDLGVTDLLCLVQDISRLESELTNVDSQILTQQGALEAADAETSKIRDQINQVLLSH